MAPHPAGPDDATPVASPKLAGCASAPVAPGASAPLDPLVFALARAVDRLGPGQPPGSPPDTAG